MTSAIDFSSPWVKILEEFVEKKTTLKAPAPEFSFPWDECQNALKGLFDLETISFATTPPALKTKETISKELGKEPVVVALYLSSISEPLFWILSPESQAALTAYFLSNKHPKESFSDPRLQEGYYYFLLLKIVNALSQISMLKNLSFRLDLSPSLTLEDSAFCVDVSVSLPSRTIGGKLIYSSSFFEHFIQQLSPERQSVLQLKEALGLTFPFNLHVGDVTLKPEEWKRAQAGDLVVLDKCSFDPETQKGSTELFLSGQSFLRARFKSEGLKITDYSFHTQEMLQEKEEDPSKDLEEEKLESSTEEIPESSTEISEENFSEHLPQELTDLPEEAPLPSSVESFQEIPLKFDIVMGKIDLKIETLLGLTPGTLVEASSFSTHSVHLLHDQTMVAQGELIKLGEIIGVRLLDIMPFVNHG